MKEHLIEQLDSNPSPTSSRQRRGTEMLIPAGGNANGPAAVEGGVGASYKTVVRQTLQRIQHWKELDHEPRTLWRASAHSRSESSPCEKTPTYGSNCRTFGKRQNSEDRERDPRLEAVGREG